MGPYGIIANMLETPLQRYSIKQLLNLEYFGGEPVSGNGPIVGLTKELATLER